MAQDAPDDASDGYEAVSREFIAGRMRSTVGATTVRKWAASLPPGGEVLDLGCGCGVPITRTLIELGLRLYGVDAAPSMVADFRARFPDVPVECASVTDSLFFGRTFDGVLAWGLMFLLPPPDQVDLVRRMSAALKPDGRLLFTSPEPRCTWRDNLTGSESMSLGAGEYRRLLEAEGLVEIEEAEDEGENHYYFGRKPS